MKQKMAKFAVVLLLVGAVDWLTQVRVAFGPWTGRDVNCHNKKIDCLELCTGADAGACIARCHRLHEECLTIYCQEHRYPPPRDCRGR